jgi:hypothetical protein
VTTDAKTLEFSSTSAIPGHTMFGEFALPGRLFSTLLMDDLADFLVASGRKPRVVRLAKIYAKPRDYTGIDDFEGERYEQADPSYPGLVVQGMPNPDKLPYRMVDGRRRLHKLRLQGRRTALFYVFDYEEIEHLIRDVRIVDK